jgi:flavin-dependent dehydrogenase
MTVRKTKRGASRTDIGGNRDLLVCGASFAGLMVARQVAGTGADVLVIDRYEIGERQTSACAIPTAWLETLGLLAAECQRFDELVVHTPNATNRVTVPWSFSTFDYRTLCDLLWADADAEFETAKVDGAGQAGPDGRIPVRTDRGTISAQLVVDAMGWRRVLAREGGYQPPEAPLSRGLEVHPAGVSQDLEVWIDRRYVPEGYGWSFPAGEELRIGIGSFDPEYHVRRPTEELVADLEQTPTGWQGNWIPHRLRDATEGQIFFVGDSAGHCLPLTAEGIRPAFYFGMALGAELKAVLQGRQDRGRALAAYGRFSELHRDQFEGLLRAQRILPKIPPPALGPLFTVLGSPRVSRWAFGKYLNVALPGFATALDPGRSEPVASPV